MLTISSLVTFFRFPRLYPTNSFPKGNTNRRQQGGRFYHSNCSTQLMTGWFANFLGFVINHPTSRLATYSVAVKTAKLVLSYPYYSAVLTILTLLESPSTTAFS